MALEGLAPYAMAEPEGEIREHEEPEKDDSRPPYVRDSDRITFSDYYRRLELKAQVFVADAGDNFRKRLTHTLDVVKLTRPIAEELKLNVALAEAIAHAHDLGHTPFGHVGEEALNKKMKKFGLRFEHNEQSLRIVEKLAKEYPGFDGLNLTKAVREGLMKHKTSWDNRDIEFEHAPHLEAQVANVADEIAYTAHDIYDGYNAGLITLENLNAQPLWQHAAELVRSQYGNIEDKKMYIKRCVSSLIGYLVQNIIDTSKKSLKENNIESVNDVRNFNGPLIHFNDETIQNLKKMREFLMENFYSSGEVRKELVLGEKIISDLFDAYYNDPSLMPEEFQDMISDGEKKEVVVKDYIAGMTDRYAKQKWEELNKE